MVNSLESTLALALDALKIAVVTQQTCMTHLVRCVAELERLLEALVGIDRIILENVCLSEPMENEGSLLVFDHLVLEVIGDRERPKQVSLSLFRVSTREVTFAGL